MIASASNCLQVTGAWYMGYSQKCWAPSGYKISYGTYYLGVPKWDPNFGNLNPKL